MQRNELFTVAMLCATLLGLAMIMRSCSMDIESQKTERAKAEANAPKVKSAECQP